MKKLLLALFIATFNITVGQENQTISGKIIDENFNPLVNVFIKNLNSGNKSHSDKNGEFIIKGELKDTLQFQYVSLKDEIMVIDKSNKNIHLIMIVDNYPEFGTKKIYKRFEKAEKKRLMKLYKSADKKGIWKK